MYPASKSGGSRRSTIPSLQVSNQLYLQSFRGSLILINTTTHGYTYVIVAIFFPLQRTGIYLVNNECVGDIVAIVVVFINNDGGNGGTNAYDYFHYIVALYD